MNSSSLSEILSTEIFRVGGYVLSIEGVLNTICIIACARILLWVIRRSIVRSKIFKTYDEGQILAYYQIAKYIIVVVAIALILETHGIKITFLVAGSAALLVGIGLGLQQLFNDLVSGFIILTEHSIKVGDIIEVEGIVARVKLIGLRTSKVENRLGIFMIIPNSKIVNENVTNWSHNNRVTRFQLPVGVAYGSDVELEARLLEEAASEHNEVDHSKNNIARFVDFGDSALQFELLFWSANRFRVEDVKSQLRFAINRKFIENRVQIPFPQRDLHLKTMLPIPFESKHNNEG